MQQLHLVGFTTDLDSVIFSTRKGAKSGGFVLPVDDKLLAVLTEAVRRREEGDGNAGAGSARPAGGLRQQSRLSPREIQARLRAGRSLADIAAEAGVGEEWVARFAAPVQAERSQVIGRARGLVYAKPRRGESGQPLGVSVRWNLADRGVLLMDDEFDDAWAAYQLGDQAWVVTFSFVSRKRSQRAEWEVDLATGDLVGRNRLASDLGYVEPGRRRRTAVSLQPEAPPPSKRSRPAPPPAPSPPELPILHVVSARGRGGEDADGAAGDTDKGASSRSGAATRTAKKRAVAPRKKKAGASKKTSASKKTAASKKAAASKKTAAAKKIAATKKSAGRRAPAAKRPAAKRGASTRATATKKAATRAPRAKKAPARRSAPRATAAEVPARRRPARAPAPVEPPAADVPNELGRRRLQLVSSTSPPPATRGGFGPRGERDPSAPARGDLRRGPERVRPPAAAPPVDHVAEPDDDDREVPALPPAPPPVDIALDVPSPAGPVASDAARRERRRARLERAARDEAVGDTRDEEPPGPRASIVPGPAPDDRESDLPSDSRVVTIRANRATPPGVEPDAEVLLPPNRPPLRPAQPAAQPRRRRFGRTAR